VLCSCDSCEASCCNSTVKCIAGNCAHVRIHGNLQMSTFAHFCVDVFFYRSAQLVTQTDSLELEKKSVILFLKDKWPSPLLTQIGLK